MRQFRIIVLLLVAVVLVVFAVQNAEQITLKLLFWNFEISTALMMLICFALGSVFMLIYTIPIVGRMKREAGPGKTTNDLS
jgi:uncharacterized integral membrane protein